jgi:hypothetical protein
MRTDCCGAFCRCMYSRGAGLACGAGAGRWLFRSPTAAGALFGRPVLPLNVRPLPSFGLLFTTPLAAGPLEKAPLRRAALGTAPLSKRLQPPVGWLLPLARVPEDCPKDCAGRTSVAVRPGFGCPCAGPRFPWPRFPCNPLCAKRTLLLTRGSDRVFTRASDMRRDSAVGLKGSLPCTEPARVRSVFEARTKLFVLTERPRPKSPALTLVNPLRPLTNRALRKLLSTLPLMMLNPLLNPRPYHGRNRSCGASGTQPTLPKPNPSPPPPPHPTKPTSAGLQ